jgi:hypothetical protein
MAKVADKRFQAPSDLLAELSFLCGSLPLSSPAFVLGPAPAPGGPDEHSQPAQADRNMATVRIPAAPAATAKPAWMQSNSNVPFAEAESSTRVLPTDGQLPALFVPETASDTAIQSYCNEAFALPQPEHDGVDRTAASDTAEHEHAPASLPFPTTDGVDRGFRNNWSLWIAAIEATVKGQEPDLSESAYRALHSQLVTALRIQVNRQGNGASSAWQRLENLVAPWLTLHSLALTETDTIANLCERCQTIGRQLGLVHQHRHGRRLAMFAGALLLTVILGSFLVLSPRISLGFSWPSFSSTWRFVQTSPLVVLLSVLVLSSCYFLPRLFRS